MVSFETSNDRSSSLHNYQRTKMGLFREIKNIFHLKIILIKVSSNIFCQKVNLNVIEKYI